MANTKQAQKAIRKTKSRTNYNKWWKNQVKAAYKAVLSAIAKPEGDNVANAISTLQKKVDKSVKANIIHKNKAANIKSKLMKKASASV